MITTQAGIAGIMSVMIIVGAILDIGEDTRIGATIRTATDSVSGLTLVFTPDIDTIIIIHTGVMLITTTMSLITHRTIIQQCITNQCRK